MVVVIQRDSSHKSPCWECHRTSLSKSGREVTEAREVGGTTVNLSQGSSKQDFLLNIFSWLCKSVQSSRHSHCKRTLLSQGCWKGSDVLLIGMQGWKNCKEYLQVLSLNQNHQLFWTASLTSFFPFFFSQPFIRTFLLLLSRIFIQYSYPHLYIWCWYNSVCYCVTSFSWNKWNDRILL